jgi:hypothetical protein
MFAPPGAVLADLVLFLRHPWDRAVTSPLTHRERLADAAMLAAIGLGVMLALGFAIEALILSQGFSLLFEPPAWGRLAPAGQWLHLAVQVPLVEGFMFLLLWRRPPMGLSTAAAIGHAMQWIALAGLALLVAALTGMWMDDLTTYGALITLLVFVSLPFEEATPTPPDPLMERYGTAPSYALLLHGAGLAFALLGIGGMSGAPWPWLALARLPWLVAFWVYAWLRVRFGFGYAVAAYGLHNALLWALA